MLHFPLNISKLLLPDILPESRYGIVVVGVQGRLKAANFPLVTRTEARPVAAVQNGRLFLLLEIFIVLLLVRPIGV